MNKLQGGLIMLYLSLLCFAIAAIWLRNILTPNKNNRFKINPEKPGHITHYKNFIIQPDGTIDMIPSIDTKA